MKFELSLDAEKIYEAVEDARCEDGADLQRTGMLTVKEADYIGKLECDNLELKHKLDHMTRRCEAAEEVIDNTHTIFNHKDADYMTALHKWLTIKNKEKE